MSSTTTSVELSYPPAAALAPMSASRTRSNHDSSILAASTSADGAAPEQLTRSQSVLVIACVTVITAISTLLAGVVVVATPTFAKDIDLSPNLLFWPASIFSLTCGCTLLISGSIADVVGSSNMYLIGSALQSAFTLACGLSQTGTELILFRGLAGIATSLCLPSAVSIITHTFPHGPRRNAAFSAMGGGQPLGFALGLTLGGVFTGTIGWRWAFHLAAILNTGILVMAIFALPNTRKGDGAITWSRLANEIDWIGAFIASTSLATLSYVLATLSGSVEDIHATHIIVLLSVGMALIPAFVLWVGRQESLGRPALVPNSLWKNRAFTVICINVFITWGTFNSVETLLSFVFQYVQKVTPIQTSLRFLPAPVAGTISNIVVGMIVHKVNADRPVLIGNVLAGASPLIMALINPKAPYWTYAFPAMAINAIGADTLFTIANLVTTSAFPEKTQALAGGVFNTIGKTVGMATSAVVASSITSRSLYTDKESPEALLEGYKAAFWYCFALCVMTIPLNIWGLRNIGKVGAKRD